MLWRDDMENPNLYTQEEKSQREAYHHFPKEGAIVSEENRGVPNLYVVYVVYMYISRIIIFSSCH